MTIFDDLVSKATEAQAAGNKCQQDLAAAEATIAQQAATITDLQQQLADCLDEPGPTPTAGVMLGVNDRYYDDFSAKVVRHLCQRHYAATASPGSGEWPGARAAANAGQKVFMSVKFSDASPWNPTRLSAIHDYVGAWATRPTLDPFHEFEDNVEGGEFTVQEYVANARAFYDALHDVADIGWCTMAYSFGGTGASQARQTLVKACYPGDDYVDVIAADGYIRENANALWTTVYGGWLSWAKPHGKPLAILEWGVNENASGMTQALRAAKTNEFFEFVRANPEIETACLWESTAVGNYEIRDDPLPRDAYKAKAADPYFGRLP